MACCLKSPLGWCSLIGKRPKTRSGSRSITQSWLSGLRSWLRMDWFQMSNWARTILPVGPIRLEGSSFSFFFFFSFFWSWRLWDVRHVVESDKLGRQGDRWDRSDGQAGRSYGQMGSVCSLQSDSSGEEKVSLSIFLFCQQFMLKLNFNRFKNYYDKQFYLTIYDYIENNLSLVLSSLATEFSQFFWFLKYELSSYSWNCPAKK